MNAKFSSSSPSPVGVAMSLLLRCGLRPFLRPPPAALGALCPRRSKVEGVKGTKGIIKRIRVRRS